MPSLPIFDTAVSGSTAVDVDRLSRTMLAGRDAITSTRGAMTQVRGPEVVIDVDASRGGVWSGDTSRMWRADRIKAPEARGVTQIAQSAFKAARLRPELDASFRFDKPQVRYGQLATEIDGKRTSSPTEAVYTERVVVEAAKAGLKTKTLPIFGGGGKITATVGDAGQVVGLSSAWRSARSVDERELMSPDAAIEAAGLKKIDGVQITSTVLGYYAAPSFVDQDIMFPVYAVNATVSDGKRQVPSRVRLIPATDIGRVGRPETPQLRRSTPRLPVRSPELGIEQGRLLPHNISVDEKVLAKNGIKPADVLARTASGQYFIKPTVSGDTLRSIFEALRKRSFGTSWIGEFGGLGGSQANAQGFVNELNAEGWERRFNWGNQSAWKSDWLQNDDAYVDDVDFVFYTGHASPDGWMLAANNASAWISFSETGANANTPSDFWGQDNLEWAVVAACGPLQDDLINGGGNVFDRWRRAFDGLHLLMGYSAVTFDNEEEGKRLASYARSGMTLMQSWFRAAQEIQPATNSYGAPNGPDVYAAAMYTGNNQGSTGGDHLWGRGTVGPDVRGGAFYACSFSPC